MWAAKRILLGTVLVGGCGGEPPPDASASADLVATSCDARAYGAKGDGTTKDTTALQAAIDACAGGGEVHLQNGTFLSGMLTLKSNVVFHVHGGATLKGSPDDIDYPDTSPPTKNSQLSNCKKTLLYAEGVNDLHITGAGTIDGGGDASKWTANIPEKLRPMAMFFVQSNGVWIENVTVKNAAMWGVVNMETDNVTIRNITVDSTHGSTRDGIDIVDGHHVLIENVTVSSEDDAICLKSGVARGVDDVIVRNSHVLTAGVANGLKIGTATYGPFSNIHFQNIDIAGADKAAIAVESVDGAAITDVTFDGIRVHDVGTPFFVLLGNRGDIPGDGTRHVGSMRGLTFSNITGDAARHDWGAIVSGLSQGGQTYPITDVTFEDVKLSMQGTGTLPAEPAEYGEQYPDANLWDRVPGSFFLRHVAGIRFTRTQITTSKPDVRPLIDSSVDVTGLVGP